MKLAGGILLLVLGGCAGPGPAPAGAEAGAILSGQDLAGFLSVRGYSRVPMARLPTGHFSIAGRAGTVRLDMIVDTGASHTVIDIERAARFSLATEDQGSRATGIGVTGQRVESGRLEEVAIGPMRFDTLRVTVIDLSRVNQVLLGLGSDAVDGIIGADVLMAKQAVIDYGSLMLYVKE